MSIASGGTDAAVAAAAGAGVAATGLDEHELDRAGAAAIAAGLTSPGGKAVRADDKHPEKRMKAAFKGYEDRELPKLRAEFPTLRRSQLNELLFRNWSRSSENPLNAAKLGGDSDR